MIKREFDSRINELLMQRKKMMIGLFIFLSIILIQGIVTIKLSGKRERVVLIPPVITDQLWLDESNVSESYLKQLADYYLKMVLNVTPSSIESQTELLLKKVHPSAYGDVKSDLVRKIQEVKKKSISTAFFPVSYVINTHDNTVDIVGDLILLVGKQKVKPQRKSFKVSFLYDSGTLFLEKIIEEENE